MVVTWVEGGQERWNALDKAFNTDLFTARDDLAELADKIKGNADIAAARKAVSDLLAAHDGKAITFAAAEGLLKEVNAALVLTEKARKVPDRLRREEEERTQQETALKASRKRITELQGQLEELTAMQIGEGHLHEDDKRRMAGIVKELREAGEKQTAASKGFFMQIEKRIQAVDAAYTEAFRASEAARVLGERQRQESERQERIRKAAAERERRVKLFTDGMARKDVDGGVFTTDSVSRAFVTNPGKFQLLRTELTEALKPFKGFSVDTFAEESFSAAGEALDGVARRIRAKADDVNGGETAAIAAAAQALTGVVTSAEQDLGSQPKKAQAKEAAAAAGIPGRSKEVIDAYEALHFDTGPQQKLRQARLDSAKGQVDMWNHIGAWMREAGLGGTPRTSPSGPLFLRPSQTVSGFATHLSQYQANAALPAARRKATIDAVMGALFPDAQGWMGVHLTQERSGYGSPENARLYKGNGNFNPGSVPVLERDTVRDRMREVLAAEIERIKVRLEGVLE